MIQVTIIGSGNVAQHLISAFSKSTVVEIAQVYSRHKTILHPVIPIDKIVNDFSLLRKVDLYIIAVTDDAIEQVAHQLPFENELIVHTSGSVAMEALGTKNRIGVFYPLQTFTKDKAVNFKDIPMCLESGDEKDYPILEKIAQSISDHVFNINSEQRKAIHVAAVFVNNFVNNLYQIGNEICLENNVPFDILKPLITETASKIMTLDPVAAQTGPAKRNDQKTIDKHLDFLQNKLHKDLYKQLTQSIQQSNGKKL
ncbi:Rossmann-like and DUF2520 domain-containing protein [Flavobacterium sp. '19STA2R22 D10 B1']|uniref:Rossmann-like and DUF2520 domain-containing protein n=1 Tax=Flavobacterium aerium TaxID=3037261 RepID=UPI00278C5475|nr:Rossmann-like and DUF2520 domain-containing protein [Flavobacterium sp. '19STA2R22 D10 B1']